MATSRKKASTISEKDGKTNTAKPKTGADTANLQQQVKDLKRVIERLQKNIHASDDRIEELENKNAAYAEEVERYTGWLEDNKRAIHSLQSQNEYLSAFLEDAYELMFGDEGGHTQDELKAAIRYLKERNEQQKEAIEHRDAEIANLHSVSVPPVSPGVPEGKVLVDKAQLEEIVIQVQEMRAVCMDLTDVTIQTYEIIGGQIPKSITEAVFAFPKLLKKLTSNQKYLDSLGSMADKVKSVIPFVVPKDQALQLLRMFPANAETQALITQVEQSTKLLNK